VVWRQIGVSEQSLVRDDLSLSQKPNYGREVELYSNHHRPHTHAGQNESVVGQAVSSILALLAALLSVES